MKMRGLFVAIAGLVPALAFPCAPAGAAPPSWAHVPGFVRARAGWQSPAGPVSSAGVPASQHAWPEQKVTASDWASGDLYGYSSALTPDTAFVAAPHAAVDGNRNAGAVYVYRKESGAWIQVQKLTASDGAANDEFGISIAVSGKTLLVGAVVHDAAYVFNDYGGTWTQSQELTVSGAVGFGYVVALDGGTAVIGAPGNNGFAGAAYVFKRLNGAWSETGELTASDGGAGEWFGKSVGISGNTILVGMVPPPAAGAYSVQGAVYVFTRSDSGWSQARKLTAGDGGIGDGFGFDLAVSGSTAFISAPIEQVGTFNLGAVYVFSNSGGAWHQAQKLIGSDDTGPNVFGFYSVALHGNTAVVGVPGASFDSALPNPPSLEGAAYVFTRADGRWNREKVLRASDASAGEAFGSSVGLAGNGVLAATMPEFGGSPAPDAAYIFGPINLGVTAGAP